VTLSKTLSLPSFPTALDAGVAPPAPTVTVYLVPIEIALADCSQYPPAPPPPPVLDGLAPEPPPAITKRSDLKLGRKVTVSDVVEVAVTV
jgi:hypothetical protein